MPSEVDLTTAATAAELLGVPADASLSRLVTAASTAVAKWLGYSVHRRENVTETLASSGGPFLFLRSGALRSIAEVRHAGAVIPASSYRIENAIRGRLAGTGWPFTGSSTIGVSSQPLHAFDAGELAVTFSAGWVTPGQKALTPELQVDLPADLEQAALEVVTAMVRRKGRDGDLASLNLGAGSISYGEKHAIPSTARELLAPYRKRLA